MENYWGLVVAVGEPAADKRTLLVPLAGFAASCIFYGYLYIKTRDAFWAWIAPAGGRATLYSIVAVVLLPLFAGAWADILDFSKVLQGHGNEIDLLSCIGIEFAIGFYCYVHACGLHGNRMEKEETSRNQEKLNKIIAEKDVAIEQLQSLHDVERAELICQRDFLLRQLAYFREAIGARSDDIRRALNRGTVRMAEILDPVGQRQKFVLAVRKAYEPLIDNSHTLRVALFSVNEAARRLDAVFSFDGEHRDWHHSFDDDDRKALSLENHASNLAVNVWYTSQIRIVEDAELADADVSTPFSYYGSDEKMTYQREFIKSLVAIPLTPNDGGSGPKYVLVLDSNQRLGFRETYEWKAHRVRGDLGAKLRLLDAYQSVVEFYGEESWIRESH